MGKFCDTTAGIGAELKCDIWKYVEREGQTNVKSETIIQIRGLLKKSRFSQVSGREAMKKQV